MRQEMERYMSARPCPACKGQRLRPEALGVTITDLNIVDVTSQIGDRRAAVGRSVAN